MYGAILGDIIGSPYEFDQNNIKSKDFPLFSAASHFTDDTVMTLAVAQGLMDGWGSVEATKEAVIRQMQAFGGLYPDAGYGLRFQSWLESGAPQPYNSFGNGAAMRVAAAGWLFESPEDVLTYAKATAEVTHNHPEGIKGAQATALAIWMARHDMEKARILQLVGEIFEYSFDKTCDEIRPTYHHVESCQETVPQALTAFKEGKDFEDVIRTAVSLGGDSDTLAAIAGSLAEAFYGVPQELIAEANSRLDERLMAVIRRFITFTRDH